jgi:hypothetical protein
MPRAHAPQLMGHQVYGIGAPAFLPLCPGPGIRILTGVTASYCKPHKQEQLYCWLGSSANRHHRTQLSGGWSHYTLWPSVRPKLHRILGRQAPLDSC